MLTHSQSRLRCNRESPCSTCTKRGLAVSCSYTANVAQPFNAEQHQAHIQNPSVSMQDRIRQLENLVANLMQQTAPKDSIKKSQITVTPEAADSRRVLDTPDRFTEAALIDSTTDDASLQSDLGCMKLNNTGVSYVRSAH
jgi:hypothetical protein